MGWNEGKGVPPETQARGVGLQPPLSKDGIRAGKVKGKERGYLFQLSIAA